MRPKISVCIISKNEESRISGCIKSVLNWADEIIVVDDESSDRTAEIAESLGAKVFHRKMDIEGRHRNWAYAQARNDWVFSVDCDERPTEELKEEIDRVLTETDCALFDIPFRNYIGDYWIRWGGWYPSPKVKLFRKSRFKYEEVDVHPRIFIEGECGHLKNDVIHYTYRDWEDFAAKTNRQTTLEAKKWHDYSLADPKKARYKMNLVHAIWRTLDRFIRAFFTKRGYRDGFVGFMVAYFSSMYQILSYAKYREMKNSQNQADKNEK